MTHPTITEAIARTADTIIPELDRRGKEIESLRQQLADKHQLFMCASANYDRLAEQLAECERERDELVAALEQVKHDTESQRVWNGTGWTYRYPFGRIHNTAQAALAKLGADKTGEK